MDEIQKRAINHGDGPALVIAGPGSGKTSVIVKRLERLVLKVGVPPSSIVAISFTKASSEELKTRSLEVSGKLSEVYFGTFHSFFLHLLTVGGFYSYKNVLGNQEKSEVLKKILQEETGMSYVADEVLAILDKELAKSRRKKEESLSHDAVEVLVRQVSERYEVDKKKNHRIDFEDILDQTWKHLQENKEFRERIQRKYRYFLVDEYQDINRTQFEVLRLLLGKRDNLFAVGDEDQSIYAFRGSDPNFLTGFEEFFPKASIYPMSRSYRCPQSVLDLSNRLIQRNQDRTEKQIRSASDRQGKVNIRCFSDESAQARSIRETMERESITPKDCMVIYRTHRQALALAKEFSDCNIPFEAKDYRSTLFRHFIYKDVMAYAELIAKRRSGRWDWSKAEDINRLHRVLNKPYRGLKPLMLEKNNEYLSWDRRIERFYRRYRIGVLLFSKFDKMEVESFERVMSSILEELSYRKYLEEYARFYKIDYRHFEEVIAEIKEMVPSGSDIFTAVENLRFLEHIHERELEKSHLKKCGVLLTTAHGSKGLERDHVFLISLNQGLFPHKKSMEERMEEERRLFYVALTRTKANLTLSYLEKKQGESDFKSCFLSEMGL